MKKGKTQAEWRPTGMACKGAVTAEGSLVMQDTAAKPLCTDSDPIGSRHADCCWLLHEYFCAKMSSSGRCEMGSIVLSVGITGSSLL